MAMGDTLSGRVALEFLERSAERQGVDLTPQKLDQIRWGLADRYLSTLESIAQDTGSVTEELRSRPIWNIHSEELSKYGLDKDAWTLNTPFELMGDRQREAYWEAVLDSAGDPGREFALAKDTALKMAAMHHSLEFWSSLSKNGEELREAADRIEAWASRLADLDTLADSFRVGLNAAFNWVDDLLQPLFQEMAKDFLDFAFELGDSIREIGDAA
ncbi:MAG TPA: hypothetical protein EYP34_09070 [Chromatiaceae bacterium]|nr:hypothetical protein [Chromatiaceae bacterium]